MATQPLNPSSRDVVLIDDTFDDIRDAALFGPDYIFVHNLQTRRQRFPRDLHMADLPQWFEAKRMLIPHETKVSCLDGTAGPGWEREFLPIYVSPESALLEARGLLVSAPAVSDLESRKGVFPTDNIPRDLDQAFRIGQSRFHVLQDFYIACAETTDDPVSTLRALVAKTEGYHVRRVWGHGGSKDEESLDLPPTTMIDKDQFLGELLARRLEERFFWNWKLHAIVASRRERKNLGWLEASLASSRWQEDELGNPFAVQMLHRIRVQQEDGFPISDIRPWSGTGRYTAEDLPQHWRGSLTRLSSAVDDKEDLDVQGKRRKRRKKESGFRLRGLSDANLGLGSVKFERLRLTEAACAFLDGLHPDCGDIDLPLRMIEWLKEPHEATEGAMAKYVRTWFGKLFRHQQSEREAAST
jgi:hypothetical protein